MTIGTQLLPKLEDAIAKILQGGIIGIAVFLIPSTVRISEKMPKINR